MAVLNQYLDEKKLEASFKKEWAENSHHLSTFIYYHPDSPNHLLPTKQVV